MEEVAGLDLVVRGTGETGYQIWVILWRGKEEIEQGPFAVRGSFDPLDRLAGRPLAYSHCLSQTFFANRALLDALRWGIDALQGAGGNGEPSLPLRLRLEPYNSPLQRLSWELLGYPDGGPPLAGQRNLRFSRFVSPAWPDPDPRRMVSMPRADPHCLVKRPRPYLRGLFAGSNPGSLARLGLAPVNLQLELDRSGLNGIGYDIFPAFTRPGERCTLESLPKRLLTSPDAWPYDLLYLVCHARFDRKQPYLYFEDPAGGAQFVSGSELANRLNRVCPSLVVLAHPAESTPFAGQALLALGALLARDSAGAVLVMPGPSAPRLLPGLMRRFLAELGRRSEPDLALARVRQALLGINPGWWQPVLFLGRRDSRLWANDP